MSNENAKPIAPNAMRLLWAGFMAILAAGVGFAVRNALLATWGAEFSFNSQQLGAITGAGLTGFAFGIIIGGVLVDKMGYGKLVLGAFVFHVGSAFVSLSASSGMEQQSAYQLLYWGSFIFALANGTLEAVANPLVATLFPHNRTHYLNILHASWPAGLVLGGAAAGFLGNMNWSWKSQFVLFLIPSVVYGLMFLGQKFPRSEASEKGLSLGEMMKDVGLSGALIICALLVLFFQNALGLPAGAAYALGGILLIAVGVITKFSIGSILLFVLFITHALVGAVELGTDSWMQNITGNILTPSQGNMIFVYTSFLMFALRFCADFIEKRLGISPIMLLFICAVFACAGLNLASAMTSFASAIVAYTVYAIGKTFFWPTMLAVASDRFPRTGAVAISIMGGIGMLSAGLVGSAGLGYAKDRFSAEALQTADAALYEEYKSNSSGSFLIFDEITGLDGAKLGEATGTPAKERTEAQQKVVTANMQGDRDTLKADSVIPAIMALIYLGLFFYFKATGGYKVLTIADVEGGGSSGPAKEGGEA